MIKLAEAEYIRHLWEVEGKSLREISRVTNLNFRTVQKYTIKTDWNETAKPKKVSYYPVLGDYIETINDWLQADEREPRKQRHTIRQIHKRLVKEKGFTGSYSSVKKYIRKKRLREGKTLDGSLPLSHNKGHAQIDFGELKYYDSQGNGQKGHYLTICFPYSNAGFVQVFKSENQECLLEGMKSIFTYVGGVPKVIKADNMTTAVTKILPQGKRELAEGFRRFMLHYRFQGEFCNPAKGNEKGSVENKVGYTRRNFFVPVPTITDFESYNKELLQICEQDMEREHYLHGVTIKELWHEEQRELLSLPENEYRVFRYETVRINNYGFVTIDNNKYGVTPELAGEQAEVKIYFNRIEIYFEHTLLKTYERCYGQNQE
ncbi:IS21 family transposase, partial [Tyzzerella sp. OttesenSCG-928-J15]|nr:IS21 family transposase [Tyzzerella sp. OttesenSCG-928-J15]